MLGEILAAREFAVTLNPKMRGPAWRWDQFSAWCEKKSGVCARAHFGDQDWKKWGPAIQRETSEQARAAANRLLRASALLEWWPGVQAVGVEGQESTATGAGLRRDLRIGDLPYGKRPGPDGLPEDHPEEIQVVELVRSAYARGMSVRKIAEMLSKDGVPARPPHWRAADLTSSLEKEAAEALSAAQKEGLSGAALVRRLNRGSVPPRAGHWSKSSVHYILQGSRRSLEKADQVMGHQDSTSRLSPSA